MKPGDPVTVFVRSPDRASYRSRPAVVMSVIHDVRPGSEEWVRVKFNNGDTMTFLDALRTGKPLRRRGWWQGNGADRWLILDCAGSWTWPDGSQASPPRRGDMLAEDWEVPS